MKRSLQLNPDNRPATWEQIKYWRDTHETSPVATSLGEFDFGERSEARMSGSLGQFNNLPTLNAEGKLTWKLADNSYLAMTQADLQTVFDEAQTNRAVRGSILHVKAEQFKFMATPPTPAQLSSLSFWLA